MFFLLQQIPCWINIINNWFSHLVLQLALSWQQGIFSLSPFPTSKEGGGKAWQNEKKQSVILLAVLPEVSYAGRGVEVDRKEALWLDTSVPWLGEESSGRLEKLGAPPSALWDLPAFSLETWIWKLLENKQMRHTLFLCIPFSMAKQTQRLLTPMD